MDVNKIIGLAQGPEWVEQTAAAVQPAVIKAFEKSGKPGQAVKNFLHGTWLGHPLHPILTDVPIGAYTVTAAFDALELCGAKQLKAGADASLAIGLVGAAGAAVTGMADWTGTSGQNRRLGMMHAVLNVSATLLNVASLALRKKKSTRGAAIGFSLAAYGITTLAAYLGGHLVYEQQMGVDHTSGLGIYPLAFTDACEEAELQDGGMKKVTVGDIPVLLARSEGQVYAIVNTCSHLGGPLDEGELLPGARVKCPWHGSVFSLKDGSVVDGPATQSQPKFETRVQNGKVQIRLSQNETIKRKDTEDQLG